MKTGPIKVIFALAIILTTSALASAAQLSLDSNTIALWHFNENSGNTLFDETSNNNDGTITGATWTLDSISESALEFDGIDDKISITKTFSVDLTKEVTLEANIKRRSGTDGLIISKNGPYFMAIRNNVIVGGIYANGGGPNTWTESSGTTILQQNVWYYLKMTYNGTAINVYIDDNLENSTPKTGQMPQVSQSIFLAWGEPGHDQFFTGIIDDARISDIARNSANNNSQNSTNKRECRKACIKIFSEDIKRCSINYLSSKTTCRLLFKSSLNSCKDLSLIEKRICTNRTLLDNKSCKSSSNSNLKLCKKDSSLSKESCFSNCNSVS